MLSVTVCRVMSRRVDVPLRICCGVSAFGNRAVHPFSVFSHSHITTGHWLTAAPTECPGARRSPCPWRRAAPEAAQAARRGAHRQLIGSGVCRAVPRPAGERGRGSGYATRPLLERGVLVLERVHLRQCLLPGLLQRGILVGKLSLLAGQLVDLLRLELFFLGRALLRLSGPRDWGGILE